MSKKNDYQKMAIMYDWFIKKSNIHPPKQIFNSTNVRDFHISNIFFAISYNLSYNIDFFDYNTFKKISTFKTTSLNPKIFIDGKQRLFILYTENSAKVYEYTNITENDKLGYHRILKIVFEDIDPDNNEEILLCKISSQCICIETNKRFFIYKLSQKCNIPHLDYSIKKIKKNWIWDVHNNNIIIVIPEKTKVLWLVQDKKWKISKTITYSPFNPFIGINIKSLDCFWYSVKSNKDKTIYYQNVSTDSKLNPVKYIGLFDSSHILTKYKISCSNQIIAFHKNSDIHLFKKFPFKTQHMWISLPISDLIEMYDIKNIKKIKLFDVPSYQNKIYLVFITDKYIMKFFI